VNEQDFLRLVRRKGFYSSMGEASRAVNAVFGTIKSWISPAASDQMRQMLPRDAAHLWQYSPVSCWSDLSPLWKDLEFPHLILKVQQLGRYDSSEDARRAYGSVLDALKTLFPVGADMIIGKPLPVDAGVAAGRGIEAVAI